MVMSSMTSSPSFRFIGQAELILLTAAAACYSEAGEFGVVDLLTAQRTYFQASLAYLDALRELWTASVEIRGLLLRGSLSP